MVTEYDAMGGAKNMFHYQIHQKVPYFTLGFTYENEAFLTHLCLKNKNIKLESTVNFKGFRLYSPTYFLMSLYAKQGKARFGYVKFDSDIKLHWLTKFMINDFVLVQSFLAGKGFTFGAAKKFNQKGITVKATLKKDSLVLGFLSQINDNMNIDFNFGINDPQKIRFNYNLGLDLSYK